MSAVVPHLGTAPDPRIPPPIQLLEMKEIWNHVPTSAAAGHPFLFNPARAPFQGPGLASIPEGRHADSR